MPRPFCHLCERPQKVCLCSALPETFSELRVPVLPVLLLQHPLERKETHQSAPFLLRTLRNINIIHGRRLVNSPSSLEDDIRIAQSSNVLAQRRFSCEISADTSEKKLSNLDPSRLLLLWPGENSMEAKDVNPEDFDYIVAIDATWKYAAEMVKNCNTLSQLQKVQLGKSCSGFPKPQFLVRKPEKIGEVQGFSTAEAVALLLDQLAEKKEIYEAVMRPLQRYVELQMSFTNVVRHRSDRKGYIEPALFDPESRKRRKIVEEE